MAHTSGDRILDALMAGNRRFQAGKTEHPHATGERRKALQDGQSPDAIVVTCSDSRVPPEIIFDADLGDLFVVRVAGNVLGRDTLGSVEYAVEHLETPLLIILGHSDCGAVAAVVQGTIPSENLEGIFDAIRPAVDATKDLAGDWVDLASRENARRVAQGLPMVSSVIAEAMNAHTLTVVPAFYELETGIIRVLDTTS